MDLIFSNIQLARENCNSEMRRFADFSGSVDLIFMFLKPAPIVDGRGKTKFGGDLFLFHPAIQRLDRIFDPDLVDEIADGHAGVMTETVRQIGPAETGKSFERLIRTPSGIAAHDMDFHGLDDFGDMIGGFPADILMKPLESDFVEHSVDRIEEKSLDRMVVFFQSGILQLLDPLGEQIGVCGGHGKGFFRLHDAAGPDFGEGGGE